MFTSIKVLNAEKLSAHNLQAKARLEKAVADANIPPSLFSSVGRYNIVITPKVAAAVKSIQLKATQPAHPMTDQELKDLVASLAVNQTD